MVKLHTGKCCCWCGLKFHYWSFIVLIYINTLSEGLSTKIKLLRSDVFLFSVIHDSWTYANDLNKDLETIYNWDFQWKLVLTLALVNRLKTLSFVIKQKKLPHPPLEFNNANVTQSVYQKHLGTILESNLTVDNHLKILTTKINKTTGLLCKLQNLTRTVSTAIQKAFVRLHLDYCDILYDQALKTRTHSVQYNFGNDWCNTWYLQKKFLQLARLRITSITTMLQKTSNVLQNL